MTRKKNESSTHKNAEPTNIRTNCSRKERQRSKNKIPISINKKMVNKPNREEIARHQNCFQNKWLTINELAAEINLGHAISSHFNGDRNSANFAQAQMIWLDFDNWDLEEAREDELIKNHAAIIYTTPSHNKEDGNGDRFRVGFKLEAPIEDGDRYKQAVKALLHRFPKADQSCCDLARYFFGSKGGVL